MHAHSSLKCGIFAACILLMSGIGLQASESSEWTHRTAHNYVIPLTEDTQLSNEAQVVRPSWTHVIHTGIGKAGSGTAGRILDEGFSPTFGETGSAVVADGVYLLSWSEATGEVSGRPESIRDRYFRGEDNYEKLAETYFRIDANWNTIALDAATGEKLWQVSEPSASLNFVSSKRGHNGIDPGAGNGVYVTATVTGRIFAYDIQTGERRWEGNVGKWHEEAEAYKTEALEERNIPGISDDRFGFIRPGLVVVDGVVITPDLQGGLIGFHVENGDELWRIEEGGINNRQGAPRPWQDDGQTFLISHQNRGSQTVTMIDPRDGSILWTLKTGYNPGDLIMGEDMVLLNPSSNPREGALLAAYRISREGLTRQWQLPDEPQHRFPLRGDRKAERKGVIDDGRIYMAIGFPREERRLAVYDLATGAELYRSEDRLDNNVGHPVSYGDKLYWQVDSAHEHASGIFIYQKNDDASLSLLGEVNYRSLGIDILTDYEYPTEFPFAAGHLFLRGKTELAAIDLREPSIAPARVQLTHGWAGYVRPLEAVWVADAEGRIAQGRVEVPIRRELGVPGTTARRKDIWDRFDFNEQVPLGGAWEATATVHMDSFSYQLRMVMQEAEGEQWHGQWIRSFPGWDETLSLEGRIDASSRGGYPRRGWPTTWLKHRPVSFYSDLEAGQERVILQLHDALPRENGERRNVTICIDHDGETIVSAVAGGFSHNQSYIEVDTTHLQVTPQGISGTAQVILNGDHWIPDADWINGGSLLGQLTLNAQFGERNDQDLYPVSGSWSFEWGMSAERSGPIHATLGQ